MKNTADDGYIAIYWIKIHKRLGLAIILYYANSSISIFYKPGDVHAKNL